MNRYYFDWAATGIPTYSLQETAFGNPSSRHAEGRASRAALEDARLRIARLLGVDASCLYFTSGATESNAIVLQSLLQRSTKAGMLISSIEHPAITENALALKRLGFPLSFIPVGASGHIQEDSIYQILQNDTSIRLLCVMAVNNETGAKMDMASLVRASREASGPRASSLHFHCDAVQALAKTDVDLRVWDVDSASFSAHKIGGPRGIGLLYLRKKIEAFTLGGSQENHIRPGTENVAGALAFAEVLTQRLGDAGLASKAGEPSMQEARMASLIQGLRSMDRCSIIPSGRKEYDSRYSPYILQASFRDIPAEVMVRSLDDAGFAVSTGSACSSSSRERPVLAAMAVDSKTAFESLRFSLGWSTTESDIKALLAAIKTITSKLQ